MKSEKMVKRSSFGSIVRKKLSDITNVLPQPKTPNNNEKANSPNFAVKDYIDNLVKENLALVKLIEDKNKIIELSGLELQKLRVSFQKMQLQNWSLAQSNCHISAELKLGREKLKSLQHELVCKDALLKAKNLELKEQEKINAQSNEPQEEEQARVESKTKGGSKPSKGNKRHAMRSRSMGLPSTSQKVAETEAAESKRRCIRRQSASFQVPAEISFEIEDAKFSSGKTVDSPMHKDGKAAKHNTESQGKSMGRPSRKAAEKVQSYKEIPINLKMRRLE